MRRLLMIGLFLALLVISMPQPVRAGQTVCDTSETTETWGAYSEFANGNNWWGCFESFEPRYLPTEPSAKVQAGLVNVNTFRLVSASLVRMDVTVNAYHSGSDEYNYMQANETLDLRIDGDIIGKNNYFYDVTEHQTYTLTNTSRSLYPGENNHIDGARFLFHVRRNLNYSLDFGTIDVDVALRFVWNITWFGYLPWAGDVCEPDQILLPEIPDTVWLIGILVGAFLLLLNLLFSERTWTMMHQHTAKDRKLRELKKQRRQVQAIAADSREMISDCQSRISECDGLVERIDKDIAELRGNE